MTSRTSRSRTFLRYLLMKVFVRILKSHALQLVPGSNRWKKPIRGQHRVLHEVFGVARIARHSQSGRVQAVEVAHRLRLEAFASTA